MTSATPTQGKYHAKYPHTKDQSAEYLRQALPLMSKQSPALDPINYAIWYEYVSGINASLVKEVNALIAEGKPLNHHMATSLYFDHIAFGDEAKVQRISSGFQDVMAKVSATAAQTGDQANHYGSALLAWEKQLSSPATAVANAVHCDEILGHTGAMKQSVDGLKDRLNESQAEIGALREELLRAREEAMNDTLTGLLNRNGFQHKLEEMFGPELQHLDDFCLMLIDIDNFKSINDNFGHLFGDKVIRTVAELLRSNIKGRDIGVRFGGEEFLVCLPHTMIEGARLLGESLRKSVSATRIKRVNKDETLETVTVSIGIACHRVGETLEDCIERADRALYAAKTAGKNKVKTDAASAAT